jgi:hypothetical protein
LPSSQGNELSWFTFLLPFVVRCWAALAVALVVTALALALVARVASDPALGEFTLVKCLVFLTGAYGAVAVRRWSTSPGRVSTRSHCCCVSRPFFWAKTASE